MYHRHISKGRFLTKPPFLYVICYVSLPVGNRHFFDSYGSNRPDHYRWVIQQNVPQIRYNKGTKRARNNYIQYILMHFANIFCRERGPPDNDEPCFSSDGILRCSHISGHHFRCADKPCTTVILVQRSELPRMSIAVVLRPHQSWTDSKSRKDWYNYDAK